MAGHPLLEYLELERPLAFIDAASTGLDTRTARIVRLTVLKIDPAGNERIRSVLVNPGTPIPPGSNRGYTVLLTTTCRTLRISGLMPRDWPSILKDATSPDLAWSVFTCPFWSRSSGRRVLSSAFRAGWSSTQWRFTTGSNPATFVRLTRGWRVANCRPRREPRRPARAAAEILLGELSTSAGLPRSPRQLAAWAKGVDDRALDSEGKFIWSANNEALINFGKHRGRRLSEVAAGEPDYLEWIAGKSDFDTETRDIAKNALDGDIPTPPMS